MKAIEKHFFILVGDQDGAAITFQIQKEKLGGEHCKLFFKGGKWINNR